MKEILEFSDGVKIELGNGDKYSNVIYKITNKINGKSYIGLTAYYEKRIKDHKNCKEDRHLYRSFKKNGFENFTFKIIDSAKNYDDLFNMEKYYIGYYDTFKNGYNNTLGGEFGKKFNFTDKEKEDIKNKYLKERLHTYQIGEIYDCSDVTIAKILKEINVEIRTVSEAQTKYFTDEEKNDIKNKYVNEMIGTVQIGKTYNCSDKTIAKILKEINVEIRTAGESNKIQFNDEEISKIIELYNDVNTLIEIGKMFNCSGVTISKLLKDNNIKIRTASETTQLRKELKSQKK